MKKHLIFLFLFNITFSQYVSLNHSQIEEEISFKILNDEIKTDISNTIRPINLDNLSYLKNENILISNYSKNLLKNKTESIKFDILPVDYFIDFNSHHPYNRNNGSMIPNKGYQHLISFGFKVNLGPLHIKFNPEHHFAQNLKFDTFWEGHYPEIWAERYKLWNRIDMPERFGNNQHNRTLLGQSSIGIRWKNFNLSLSTENLWWGPSKRNSIMMSNHAEGFKHISFASIKPIKTKIGFFEYKLISGRLEHSFFTPTNPDYEAGGTKLYVAKRNQMGEIGDWRYLQALVITFSPKIIDDLTIGYVRWVQFYNAFLKGRYFWIPGKPNYFPVFGNLLRSNDVDNDVEGQTDQAAGLFLNWIWKDSKAKFFVEFYHNDSKYNLRDLILDSDHSRALTIGLDKIFKINNKNFMFSWEWTQMEQSAGQLLRNAGSWYEHAWVLDGYTHKGEVLGSSIGPGSNSQFFSLQKINKNHKIAISAEIIEHDNDFYHNAFSSAKDFRRYWKDFNLHFGYSKKFQNLWLSSKIIFIRSLNYQWELEDYAEPYYHPGRDVNNFHANIKLTYFLDF
tara:strand:+ start:884 stop:2575 length:1692 start_codon:yes stop_codon:yes gene_type:complete